MSDQNQWPKPGDSSGSSDGRQQPDGQQPPQSAPQGSGQDPWSQSGQGSSAQGASGGVPPYGQPHQPNPYGQQQGSPYGQQYGAPSAPQQGSPYGGQPQGAPHGQQQGSPYGQQTGGNPYAAAGPQQAGPQHNPYAPHQQGGNPYAAPYATGGYQPYAQRPKTNTLAILSIVFSGVAGLSLLTFVFAFFAVLAGPAGAILGHVALGKVGTTGESGRGLALAGIIVGWAATGIALIGIVIFFAILGAGTGGYSSDYGYDSGAFVG